jgi:hypothetical protein
MSADRTADAHRVWLTAEKIKLVSDRLVPLGPFGIGLDGVLAFVPVAGGLYSLVAGGWLVIEALRIGAAPWTIARMAAYVGFNTASAEVPIIGQTFDFFFRGHLMAATALQKDIGNRFGLPSPEAIAEARRRPFSISPVGTPARA